MAMVYMNAHGAFLPLFLSPIVSIHITSRSFFWDRPPLKQDGNREYRANLKPHDTKLVKDFEAALSREGLVSKNTVILLNEATSHWDTETGNPLVGA